MTIAKLGNNFLFLGMKWQNENTEVRGVGTQQKQKEQKLKRKNVKQTQLQKLLKSEL